MNHGYFFLDRNGSAENSSLSEPDLTRNVKSLPEACSCAGTVMKINQSGNNHPKFYPTRWMLINDRIISFKIKQNQSTLQHLFLSILTLRHQVSMRLQNLFNLPHHYSVQNDLNENQCVRWTYPDLHHLLY